MNVCAFPPVKRRVRAGIPVYVVDEPGPARCALMFRVGRADETLRNGGVTHLVEHLALFPLGDQPYQYNGFVDSHRTVFHAAGRPEEGLDFLATVTDSLARLPLHRLEDEHRVLSAESAGHGSGVFDALVTYRFGPRGLGILGYPELGARSMPGHAVDDWRAAWFTAANAALVVSGVAVESLRLTLPGGARRPTVAAPAIEEDLPAWFSTQGDGLAVSMVAPRTPALSAVLRILEKRLLRRLRTEMAIVYRAGVSVQCLDADSVHVVVGCDPVPDHAADALGALQEELGRLADEGPDDAELHADRLALHRQFDEPHGGYALADLLALEELLGAERRTPTSMARAVKAITIGDAASAIAGARRTALWAVPCHISGPDGMRSVSLSSKRRIEGRRLAPTPLAAGRTHGPEERLVVGEGAVGIDGGDWHVHVDFERCAGALTWSDGARVLYGEDGFVLRLLPWEWEEGAGVISKVDAALDPGLLIDMGEGSGPPDPPPATDAGSPAPVSPTRRRVKRVLAAVALGFVGLLAVVMPFTSSTLRATDIEGIEAAAVPVDASGYVRCGGSALAIVRDGADVPERGPATAVIRGACEDEAIVDVAVASVCAVLFAGGVGWAWRSRRRREQAGQPA